MKTGKVLLLAFLLCLYCCAGFAMTQTETQTHITIPMTQWNALKNELTMQESELNQFRQEFQKLKKPSAELRTQLEKAENLLKQSQTELQDVKQDLTALRKDRDELKTSLQTLKEQINKERRIHHRQIWQNRFWCLLFGVGVGLAAK